MSRLQLLILWILAIVTGIIFFNSKHVPDSLASETKLEVGDALVANSLVNTLDGLKISADGKTTTLKKIENRWSVVEKGNFPADITQVSRLINNLNETKVAQGVPASAEFYDRFDLDPVAAEDEKKPESITLMKEGEDDIELFLGKSRESTGGSGGGAGRFVRLGNDDTGVYVTQQAFSALASDPATWIVKTLSLVEEGALKVDVSAPGDDTIKPWSVSRKSTVEDLLLTDLTEDEETKINETNQLKNLFTSTTFSELLNAEEAKEKSAETGTREVRITDSSGSVFLFTLTPEKVEVPEDAPKDQPAATEPANYILSFKVINGPTRPEAPAEDASLQDKANFEARLENMGDIAISVENNKKTYEGRFLLVNKASVTALLKNRADLVQVKKKEKPKTVVTTPPVAVPTPGGPPPGIARPMIRAVTPPVAVPPAPPKTPATPKPPKKPNLTPPPIPGSPHTETNSPEAPEPPKVEKPKEEEPEKPE
ncbi:MAG: DUF4340 domain-containing protein [Akkermansiaceae bacterium]|jgi:hypothetical protein